MTCDQLAVIYQIGIAIRATDAMLSHCLNHDALYVGRGYARDAAGLIFSLLQDRVGHIITVSRALLIGMGWRHPIAAIVEDAPGEDCRRAPEPQRSGSGTGSELRLHGFEQSFIHDGLVLSTVHLAAVDDFTDVEAVLQEMGQGADPEPYPTGGAAIGGCAPLGPNAAAIEILHEGPYRAEFQIPAKYRPNCLDFLGHDHELLVDASVAEGYRPSDPDSFALRGRGLVAHPLPDDRALELGKGAQHVECKPAHAARGVEGLLD